MRNSIKYKDQIISKLDQSKLFEQKKSEMAKISAVLYIRIQKRLKGQKEDKMKEKDRKGTKPGYAIYRAVMLY